MPERLDQQLFVRHMRQDTQLHLAVVRRDQRQPGGATMARRISRPDSVRIGMFCRLGLLLLRRPVTAPVWLKLVCSRPFAG
jgi:hypothetical protein